MDGDEVEFSNAGPITLMTPKPKKVIKASGKATLNGKKVCVEGDEKKVEITCLYTISPFTVPGSGTLKIQKLKPNQLTQKTKDENKNLILKGESFTVIFQVKAPAKQPPPTNTPDPMPFYTGEGKFITKNNKIKAT